MKKLLASILLVAILFVTSCAAEPAVLLPFLDSSSDGEIDYGGVKLIFSNEGNGMDEEERFWTAIFAFDTNTMYGDAILGRIADVEKKLGVEIEFDKELDGMQSMGPKLMAGTYVADVVNYSDFGGMQNFAQAGMLLPMNGFEHIDLSETWKYGGPNVLEGAMINSVPYAVQPVSWPHWEAMGISSIIYNTELVDEYALTDPHEFWENENWYWDEFEEAYLKPPINMEEDEWVISASEKVFWYGLMYSNDVQYVTSNANGEFTVNAKPQSLIEAVQEGGDWYRDYRDKIELFSDFWTHENYDEGLAIFTVSGPTLTVSAGIDVVSGLMPFPCGPSATYGNWCQAFDRIEGWGIPITSNEPEITAHVISELFEPLDEYLGVTLEEYYKEMMFNTEIDAEIYMELIKDVRYDYTFAGGADLMRSVNNNFSSAIKSGRAANETADAYAGQITSIMTQYALPNYEYMYKNFYSLQDAD